MVNNKIYVKFRECLRAISECLLHANFTSRNRKHPETFFWGGGEIQKFRIYVSLSPKKS